jgi:hypothetical protein
MNTAAPLYPTGTIACVGFKHFRACVHSTPEQYEREWASHAPTWRFNDPAHRHVARYDKHELVMKDGRACDRARTALALRRCLTARSISSRTRKQGQATHARPHTPSAPEGPQRAGVWSDLGGILWRVTCTCIRLPVVFSCVVMCKLHSHIPIPLGPFGHLCALCLSPRSQVSEAWAVRAPRVSLLRARRRWRRRPTGWGCVVLPSASRIWRSTIPHFQWR